MSNLRHVCQYWHTEAASLAHGQQRVFSEHHVKSGLKAALRGGWPVWVSLRVQPPAHICIHVHYIHVHFPLLIIQVLEERKQRT